MSRPKGTWQLNEAKAQFSEVVRLASEGYPQIVTYRGHPLVVVQSLQHREEESQGSFKKLLFEGPPLDELEIERSEEWSSEIDL